MTFLRLVISLLCIYSCSFVSESGVQQWSSEKSVAGDMLLVSNFPDDKSTRTVGRHSKSSKSGKDKGSGSKDSNDTKETQSGSRLTDDSKSDKDSKRNKDSKSETDLNSRVSSTASDESTKMNSDKSTNSSQGESKSVSSESTETDRTASSNSSDDSRDPSESSESDDRKSTKKDSTSEDTEEYVTNDEEDTEEYVIKDSEDGPFPTDSEDQDQPPTKKPTSSPTNKPSSTTPTAAGSADKVSMSWPSNGPTVSLTDNIFDQPAVSNTPEPTYYPTNTPWCELTALGAFGVISQDRREFEFFYQIEATPDTTEDILRNDLLPLLEKAYGNRLLASLFTECGEERRLQEGENSCEARGFSRLPIDRALAGISCLPASRVETSNRCYAVDGGFRMFFDGECTRDTDEETMTTIRDVIKSGDHHRLDPRIINVMYLDISDISLDDANTSRIESVGSSETTKLPGYVIVLLTIAALSIVVGLLLFVGRRRPRETNGFDVIHEGEGDF